MARRISVAGKVTGIPNVYQDALLLEGGSRPGVLESGVVTIVGECEGTLQPKVPYTFRNAQQLKNYLSTGELYDAARFAFRPSRDDPQEVRGAQKVIAVRVNPATQGTLTLQSVAPADLIDLTSRAYGAVANQISVVVAAGTLTGPSKKLTVKQMGESDEVGDSLGYNSILIVRYTGNGTAATMNISNTQLTTSLTGQTDGTVNLTIAFSTYNTISKLVSYINAQSGYEAVAVTAQPDTYLCSTLDYVTAADIKTVEASITIDDSSTSLTMSGLTAGDVVVCEDEHMYVTTAGAPNTVIRGYNDTTPAAHTAQTGKRFYNCTGVCQAVIDWCNNYSARITAARDTAYNVGVPNTLAETYLTGGGEGSTSNSDWENALKAVRDTKYNFIVVTSNSPTVHGYLKTHLDDKWALLGQEAVGHVGAAKDETKSQLRTRAKAIQSPNICLWFQDTNRESADGVDTNYDPWAMAAMAAGIQAGTAIGTPLTNKSLEITALDQSSTITMIDDMEDFVEYGLAFAKYDGDDFRIVRGLTTWTNNDDAHQIEPSVRSAVAWVNYKVRYWIRFRHLGKKAITGDALSIKNTCRDVLEDCRDNDEAIVVGGRRVNENIVRIPAFDDIQVSKTGNVTDVMYTATYVNGNDFVRVTSVVKPYQDAA